MPSSLALLVNLLAAHDTVVTAQLREFIDAVASNRNPSVTGADGKTALQLTEAVQQSWANGRPVRLQGGHDAIYA